LWLLFVLKKIKNISGKEMQVKNKKDIYGLNNKRRGQTLKKIRRLLGLGIITLIIGFGLEDTEKNIVLAAEEKIIGGYGYTVLLKSDGTVWTWGINDKYQLGQGDTLDRAQPTMIPQTRFAGKLIKNITTGYSKTMAVTEDNTIYTWGNQSGSIPAKWGTTYADLRDYSVNDPSAHYSTVVIDGGKIKSTGLGYYGANMNGLMYTNGSNKCDGGYSISNMEGHYSNVIEDCPTNNLLKRVQPGSEVVITNAVKIQRGQSLMNTIFLNDIGELYIAGTYSGTTYTYPRKMDIDGKTVKEIYNYKWPLFLDVNNDLYVYLATAPTSKPVKVNLEGLTTTIKEVKIGNSENIWILGVDGRVYGIGDNGQGQLGATIPSAGVNIAGLEAKYIGIQNVKSIGYGIQHFPYIGLDNKLYSIGMNSSGQLGQEDVNSKKVFTELQWGNPINYAIYNNNTLLFVENETNLYVAGGDAPFTRINMGGATNIPQLVRSFASKIESIAGGSSNDIFVGAINLLNGEMHHYGTSYYYSKGLTNGEGHNLKKMIDYESNPESTTFLKGSIESYSGIAMNKQTNRIFTWGYDPGGALGLGYYHTVPNGTGGMTTGDKKSFQNIVFDYTGKVIKEVYSAPNYLKVFLTEAGEVYWFGQNGGNYQVGAAGTRSNVPLKINNLPPIEKISFGMLHTIFLDKDGFIWTVGNNTNGQLGNGTTSNSSVFYKITSLPKIKDIGTGPYSTYAIAENGELYAWGQNQYGQLGMNDLTMRTTPRKVVGIPPIKMVDGGYKNGLIVTEDNRLFVTGSDQYGQLGLGQNAVVTEPQEIIFPPSIALSTANNQVLSFGVDSLNIAGKVTIVSEDIGREYEIIYSLEGVNSTKHFSVKQYVSTSTEENFSFTIPSENINEYGSYVLKVTVKEVSTGVNSVANLNFSMLDKTNPTYAIDIETLPKWQTVDRNITLEASDLGGSGLQGYQYKWSESLTKPTIWEPIVKNNIGVISAPKSGSLYLHIEIIDNQNNITYGKSGPYYMDILAPDFVYTIPTSNQKDSLLMPITIVEASNLIVKKWAKGNRDKTYMETSGADLISNINITENGEYTLYAKDENNQETLETFSITNIIYTPELHTIKGKMIIPLVDKTNATIPMKLSHKDNLDPLWLRVSVASLILNSSNNITGQRINSNELYQLNFNVLGNNLIYNGLFYLRDDQGIETTKVNSQIEIYEDNFKTRSSIDGITLTWNESKLAEKYRVLKDGFVLYEGVEETFDDANVNLGQSYVYELQVYDGEEYITIKISNTEPGTSRISTPTSIGFGSINLGFEKKVNASIMNQEYIEYENNFQLQKLYEFRVSATDFESQALNIIEIENVKIKSSAIKNKTNTTILTINEFNLSNTPIQILHSNQLTEKKYFKWELLKGNIEFSLPNNVRIQNGITEKYSGVIYIDLVYGPN
jgi:alpha-tubulin suppressor-like RCC1 family protein